MSTVKMRHWPLILSVFVYWGTVTMLVNSSIKMNQGHLVYPLDDAYIHMAIAKNVVGRHVWGVTRYEFTSSTSSPLWTLLLAATYFVFGSNDWAPLVLNLVFGTMTIIVAYRFLARYIESRIRVFTALMVAVFVTPLPTLTVIGMEHVLHALLTLSFLYLGIGALSGDAKRAPRRDAMLVAMALLVAVARYEGVFLVFVFCILLLLQRRALFALILGIACLLPVSIYGAWCVSHGWYFLPNSVLLKGRVPQFDLIGMINSIGFGALGALQGNPHILMLVTSSLFLLLLHYRKRHQPWDDVGRANIIFIGCVLLHMQFAATGWLYRYEAYLVLMGVVVIGITLNDLMPERIAWRLHRETLPVYGSAALLILIAGMSLFQRTFGSLMITARAANNIYEQQYQMGTFLRRFYQGKTVAVNDIGAVSYLADVRLVDLWGLGTLEPARLKLRKRYTAQEIYDLTQQRGVTIAIVYDDWFRLNGISVLPPDWVRVGQWSISNNVACGSDTVSIYGGGPSTVGELMENLRRFAGEAPGDVAQYGMYLDGRR
jgi:4-amino-4-deoxy-L-arabinose transferase-like glycosyltransferase